MFRCCLAETLFDQFNRATAPFSLTQSISARVPKSPGPKANSPLTTNYGIDTSQFKATIEMGGTAKLDCETLLTEAGIFPNTFTLSDKRTPTNEMSPLLATVIDFMENWLAGKTVVTAVVVGLKTSIPLFVPSAVVPNITSPPL